MTSVAYHVSVTNPEAGKIIGSYRPIFIYDAEDLSILRANRSASRRYGYTKKEFLNLTVFDLYREADRKKLKDKLDRQSSKEQFKRIEGEHVTKSGEILFVSQTIQSLQYENRDARLVSVRDVSRYYEVQHQLERKQERLRKAQELTEAGWWELDPSTGEVWWSHKLYDLLGLKEDNIEGETDFRSLVHPDDKRDLDEAKERLRQTDEPVEYRIRMRHADGSYIHMQCRAQTERDKNGNVKRVTGISQDVSEERESLIKAREASRETEMQKRFSEQLIKNLPSAFWLFDENGQVFEWNNNLEDITGYSPEQIEGSTVISFFAEEEQEHLTRKMEKAFSEGSASATGTLITSDDRRIPLALTGIRFSFMDKIYVAGMGVDISQRIEYEHKLEQRSRDLKRAQQIAKLGSFKWKVQEDRIEWSQEEYKIYGLEEEDIDQPGLEEFLSIVHPEDREFVQERVDDILETGEFESFEHRLRQPSGNTRYVIQRGDVELGEDGKIINVFGTTQDVTRLKMTKEELKESLYQKDILLREIHHRVKNNLAIISGLLDFEAMNWMENEEVKRAFKDSQLRIQSIADIHEHLYESEDLANLPFDDYVRDLVNLIADNFEIQDRVEISVDSDPLELNVNQAIPTALVINELVTNAFEHAFNGEDQPKLQVGVWENNGEVEIRIADNGKGIPEELESFSDGSLGFTLVQQLVQQLEADINVDRDEGTGTAFVLTFEKSRISGAGSSHFT